jgi:hypothetical protein
MVPQAALSAEGTLPLPPIPYAETIPWLTAGSQQKPSPSLGLLLAPIPLTGTPAAFAAAPLPRRALLSRQPASATVFTE